MVSNINDKMFLAIQNYFYTRHRDVFALEFVVPRVKKIHKASEPNKHSSSKLFRGKPAPKKQSFADTISQLRMRLAVINDFNNRGAVQTKSLSSQDIQ